MHLIEEEEILGRDVGEVKVVLRRLHAGVGHRQKRVREMLVQEVIRERQHGDVVDALVAPNAVVMIRGDEAQRDPGTVGGERSVEAQRILGRTPKSVVLVGGAVHLGLAEQRLRERAGSAKHGEGGGKRRDRRPRMVSSELRHHCSRDAGLDSSITRVASLVPIASWRRRIRPPGPRSAAKVGGRGPRSALAWTPDFGVAHPVERSTGGEAN